MSENEKNAKNSELISDDEGRGFFQGFTLIELLMVITIMSILLAVAFISMFHYRMNINVNASAREVAGNLRLARANAIREGSSYCFQFSNCTDDNGNVVSCFHYGRSTTEIASGECSFPLEVKTEYLEDEITFGTNVSEFVPGQHSGSVADPVYYGGSPAFQKGLLLRRDGSISSGGVVYLAPKMDLKGAGGTGVRYDRHRAVDWSSGSGRVRVWKFNETAAKWQ